MKKTVIELFAGVGGFRVGLNNITAVGADGRAIEKVHGNLYGPTNGNLPQKHSMLLIAITCVSHMRSIILILIFQK